MTGSSIGRALAMAALAVVFAGPVGAQTQPDAAKSFIQDMGSRTVATLNRGDLTPPQRKLALAKLLLEAMDFHFMANSALGKLAPRVSPAEKQDFAKVFAVYFIDVAVDKFGSAQVKGFAVGAPKTEPNGDVSVPTKIERPEGPLDVAWRVRNGGAGPKINDLTVEGNSVNIHYRGEMERVSSTYKTLYDRLVDMTKSSPNLPLAMAMVK